MLTESMKVTEVDKNAESVYFTPMVKYIGDGSCFCGSISHLELEETIITSIGNLAFANCQNLQYIKFPSSLEEICDGAFMACKNIIEIIFPPDSKLNIIGSKAFYGCSKLEPFSFPPLLESIGKKAFKFCFKFSKIDLRGTKIRFMGQDAFKYCDELLFDPGHVSKNNFGTIPENIINRDSHSGKFGTDILLSSRIPSKCITELNQCNLSIDNDHPIVKKDECGYYVSNRTIFNQYSQTRHVLIRKSVEIIGKRCFFRSNLVSVTIPSSVLVVSENAFKFCTSLQWIHFAKDSRVTEIERGAFL